MRLLSRSTDHNDIQLTSFNDDDDVPPYSILSHTWIEGQEITYQDLMAGNGKEKSGYTKIQFCVDKAAEDGVRYSWVDTCCIDKSTSDELSTAINSMFRWYQRAVKCYVFLSDVHTPGKVTDAQASRITWENAFRRSRWLERGWTLQELLAPGIVEFFSEEGTRLGDKITLEQEIHQVTKIPSAALRQARLSEFSIKERMSWAAHRTTSKKEDKAYCLLGILGVFLPLIYGEGEDHALQRLREEAEKRQANQSMALSPREIADSSTLPCSRNELFPTSRLMEIADKAVDVPNVNTSNTSSLVSTQEMGENICGDYFTSIEDRSILDRYTGTYDHMSLIPESLMCNTRTREYFGTGGPKKHKYFQSDISDSRNASRSTNYVPYELGEYGMHLHNDTLIPQTATRTKNASSMRGPFPSPHRPWSSAEDKILVNLMKSEFKRDWDIIAKRLPNRSRRACESRYGKLKQNVAHRK